MRPITAANNLVDSYNLNLTRASSDFDQRQILNIGYVYDLPFFTQEGVGCTRHLRRLAVVGT